MTARTLLFLAFLASGVGCGEDRGAGTEPGPAPDLATIELVATDFRLEPSEARVGEAGTVRIRYVNEGDIPHALSVQGPAGEIASGTVAPGARTVLRADLPAGVYKWSCPLRDHERRGMTGRLRVAE